MNQTATETSISKYFEQDHDRIDELFRQFQQFKKSDFPRAKESFVSFKFGLQRHIVWEEEILFPLFERKTGMTQGGPTSVMREEHRLIKHYLEAIHEKVKALDPQSDQEEQRLLHALTVHNQKEELILYPAIDRTITQEEAQSVFEQMKELPEDRYQKCCNHD